MKPHTFKGSLIACLDCFRPASDPIHCIVSITYEKSPIELYSPNNKVIPSTCAGHECPKCHDSWYHNYDCGKVDSHGLCLNCAQQTAADINRPNHVEEIGLKTNILTPREAIELRMQHEEFVFKNLFYDPITGADLGEAGFTAGAAHIQQLEKIIEQCKVKISGYNSARAKKEVQDLNKLTPEEQEQYRRDATKTKKLADASREKREAKTAPATGNKREKNIVSMLKLLNKQDTPENRRYVTHDLLGED